MKLRQFMEGQRKNRKSLSQTNRMNLWKQAHGRCWYCGEETAKTFFVLEHVEPFSRGGADSKRNLVVSCHPCDRAKGAKNLEEFRAQRGGLEFYGEKRRPLAVNRMAQPRSQRTPEERQERRIARQERRERLKQIRNPRMVRLWDAMPGTVAALMIAEKGKYVREPYRF